MNKRQKEILQNQLDAEKREINRLKKIYNKALNDINDKIAMLMGRQDADMQHVIYRTEYQKNLKKQIESILEVLNSEQFDSISQYIAECYQDGFISVFYDIHGQGVPIITPVDPKNVETAMKTESKINEGLYKRLGEDVNLLKKRISESVSRGFAAVQSYEVIARNIKGQSNIAFNKALRIARTEGHRVSQKAAFDAQKSAKEKGADVVKQWEAVLDGKTRTNHRKLDGQIREIDEPFEINGNKAMQPSGFGDPAEDINCRCVMMQRARWALDDDELETLKERAKYFGLDKTEDFNDFKKKYMKATEDNE